MDEEARRVDQLAAMQSISGTTADGVNDIIDNWNWEPQQ
jgi:hypothetical protein